VTEYDECQDCGGHCCAIPEIPFNYLDRVRVAKEFGMSVGHVTKRFARLSVRDGKPMMFLKFVQPCMFWTCGRCSIHHIKPEACAEFVPYKFGCQERLLHSIEGFGLGRSAIFAEVFWNGLWLGQSALTEIKANEQ
jgi:Fe-S-cluster containining protein